MKILLYSEALNLIKKSGLGKAIEHQKKALKTAGVNFTTNINDDYDILHINTYFLKSYLLAKKARKSGKKIVYHAHSTEEDFKDGFIFCRQTSKLFKKWICDCYNLGDVIITPTVYSKKILESYNLGKKIFVVSNGVDLNFFKPDIDSRYKFRKKYNIGDSDKLIIGVGLYIERKGIVDFVEIAKRCPSYKFIWFGYSPLNLATKAVRKAVNTKLDNLIFAGYVEQEIIRDALNACDLYLFPTKEETEGIPVLEAAATKTNMIVRDIPVFQENFTHGENLYKAKTVDEFVDIINNLFAGKLKSSGDKAFAVAQKYSIENTGYKLKKAYEYVMRT